MEPVEPLLSRKQQRAADIREALREYGTVRNPWGPEYRAQAVRQGVQRNNGRITYRFEEEGESGGSCCCCFGRLLLLIAACALAWFAWTRVAMNLSSLGLATQCDREATFVQAINCTLIQTTLFVDKLAILYGAAMVD